MSRFRNLRLRTTLILSYFLVVIITLAVVGTLALPLLLNNQQEKDNAEYQRSEGIAASELDRVRGLTTVSKPPYTFNGITNPFKDYFGTPITGTNPVAYNYPSPPDLQFVHDQFVQLATAQGVRLLVLRQGEVLVDTASENSLAGFSLDSLYALVTPSPGITRNTKAVYKLKETVQNKCPASNLDFCQSLTLPTTGEGATIVYRSYSGDLPNLFGLNSNPTPRFRRPQDFMVAAVVPVPPPDPILGQLARIFAGAAAVALLVAVIASVILARSIAKPLVKVTAATEAVARGDYSHNVPVQGGLELSRLVESFNRMAHEVEEYQRMQRELIANVSHELKTPLTAIRGFSQAMTDGTLRRPEDFALPAQIINKETERTIRLVNSLLELSKLESGTARFNKEPLDLTELLAGTLLSFSPRANENDVLLVNRLQPTSRVLGDHDRLRQVFNNLIDNALKYTPPMGQIVVSCQQVGNQVLTSVADSGVGIPAVDLPRVFERFYQADKSRSKPIDIGAGGLGLGLTICREIVIAHGGKIEVESKPGQGTKFTVTLPVLLDIPHPNPPAEALETQPGQPRELARHHS